MRRFTAVIFDVDGTLVDSNDIHAEAWVDALGRRGYPVPFEKIRPLIGMGGDKIIPRVTDLAEGSPEAEALSEFRGKLFLEKYVARIEPFPRVRELFLKLREHDLKLGIATSAKKDELEAILRIAGVADLLDRETSSDDAESSKPDPDIVSAAVTTLGAAPGEAILVGDTPYDLEAASRAGVASLAFRCGRGWSDRDFERALAIYDGPWDLEQRFSSSPLWPFDSAARNEPGVSAA